MSPYTCVKCDTTVKESSWELEWKSENEIEAFFHCPNAECEVEVWKSIFRFDGQETFSMKGAS
jgi:hypothetical protein